MSDKYFWKEFDIIIGDVGDVDVDDHGGFDYVGVDGYRDGGDDGGDDDDGDGDYDCDDHDLRGD